jgi:hypothetical protein
MINVKIGGAVQKYELILMWNLKHKELLKDLQVTYYDMPNNCAWNGGRINRTINLTENMVATYNKFKRGICLGFTNNVILDVGDETGNLLLKMVTGENNPHKLHGVVLCSETLRRYLRKNYPELILTYSITGHPTTDQLNFEGYYKELEAKYDVIVPKYSHLPHIIELMESGKLDGSKYEILVNDNCNTTCQFYSEHFAQISHMNSSIKAPWEDAHEKAYHVEIKPKIKAGPITKEANCVQDDIKAATLQRFYNAGVRHYKVSGRDLDDIEFEYRLPEHLTEIQQIEQVRGSILS